MTIPAQVATLLEMAATSNGFDVEAPAAEGWLAFSSSRAPLQIWLRPDGEMSIVALSQQNVAAALADHGAPTTVALPVGARAARVVGDKNALHRLLRRAFQLSRALPDELLHDFEKQTAALPKTTEAERLVVQRVGQNIFRAGLLEYWDGRCAITGLAVPELLRASHIKPWAHCSTDTERLDVFNGLLLAAHLDAAFDCGFITVADDGGVIVSPLLKGRDRQLLGLDDAMRVPSLDGRHCEYLVWHRTSWFKTGGHHG